MTDDIYTQRTEEWQRGYEEGIRRQGWEQGYALGYEQGNQERNFATQWEHGWHQGRDDGMSRANSTPSILYTLECIERRLASIERRLGGDLNGQDVDSPREGHIDAPAVSEDLPW